MNSARDYDGHGSHTLSTAGGSFVPDASIFGIANGTAKGGSPRARVAAYKVCWPPVNGSECFDADIIAAFDMAIHDGVDVLSVSLGGEPTQYFNDGMAIGSFHAIQRGIVVVCSAGNSGPTPSTVTNVAPWLITVGASTVDREFQTFVELGNGKRLKVCSMSVCFIFCWVYKCGLSLPHLKSVSPLAQALVWYVRICVDLLKARSTLRLVVVVV